MRRRSQPIKPCDLNEGILMADQDKLVGVER